MTAILSHRYCQRIALEVAAGINLGLPESQALIRSHEALRDLLNRIAACRFVVSNPGYVAIDAPDELARELEEATR